MIAIEEIKAGLAAIYDAFERRTTEFKKDAVCALGCTFCCTSMGAIDITTMEGLVIREAVEQLAGPLQGKICKKIKQDRKKRERNRKGRCPFLDDQGACVIYPARPFSCRRLYSLRRCSDGGPMVHRQAMALADRTILDIQHLDKNGYSGHHSFILYLLDQREFRALYRSGGFEPQKIMQFGKSHGIVINRAMVNSGENPDGKAVR